MGPETGYAAHSTINACNVSVKVQVILSGLIYADLSITSNGDWIH